MQVWGITSARDEADIILQSLLHVISEGVDGIVIGHNLSVDGTGDLIRGFALGSAVPVVVFEDTDPAWDQAAKMTRYAHMAADRGADWIMPFDVDELLCGVAEPAADVLRQSTDDVLGVQSFTHVETSKDAKVGNAFERLRWRRHWPSSIRKMCYRFRPDWKLWHGNDGVTDLKGNTIKGTDTDAIRMHHFPMRTFAHFCAKNATGSKALAAAKNVPVNIGSHWRKLGAILAGQGVDAMRVLYDKDWNYADTKEGGLIEDPAPWCRYAH